MICCYFDESGTDDLSPVAVIGGVVLQNGGFFWLDVEWEKKLAKHGISPPLHMREFTPHGRLAHLSHDQRRALFRDLVWIINDNKNASIGATLTTEQYRKHYLPLVPKKAMGVYGLCFLLAAMVMGKQLQHEGYPHAVPYILDNGNSYRKHVSDAHTSIVEQFQRVQFINMGPLTFDTDDRVKALQAADVVSWSVRRRLTGVFNNGFEPLAELFDDRHLEQPLEESWLIEIADGLRAKMEAKS